MHYCTHLRLPPMVQPDGVLRSGTKTPRCSPQKQSCAVEAAPVSSTSIAKPWPRIFFDRLLCQLLAHLATSAMSSTLTAPIASLGRWQGIDPAGLTLTYVLTDPRRTQVTRWYYWTHMTQIYPEDARIGTIARKTK
uniref:DUF4338 domain-containing protein n=1 Tax=Steinernema glaseri TaxID=37863 RepID=A0A1I7Z351_9BILA